MTGVLAYVTLFAGNFAPRGWAQCNGQILPISQNTALFSLIGTFYGGDGRTTFALPDLRGRAVVGAGQGPGLSNYEIGQVGGTEGTSLISNQLAAHNHTATITTNPPSSANNGNASVPTNGVYAPLGSGAAAYSSNITANMKPYQVSLETSLTGQSVPFSNRNPYLALIYIICLSGVFPSRP